MLPPPFRLSLPPMIFATIAPRHAAFADGCAMLTPEPLTILPMLPLLRRFRDNARAAIDATLIRFSPFFATLRHAATLPPLSPFHFRMIFIFSYFAFIFDAFRFERGYFRHAAAILMPPPTLFAAAYDYFAFRRWLAAITLFSPLTPFRCRRRCYFSPLFSAD